MRRAGSPSARRSDPLFEFQLQPSGMPRRWRNVLNRQRFQARLQQPQDAQPHDDVGEEIMFALRDAIDDQLDNQVGVEEHHTLHFTLQSDQFTHAFQSTTFTVGEFRSESPRFRTYLQSLADKLNSNEDFEANDTFTLEMTLIRTPGRGGRGKRDRKRVLGKTTIESILKSKSLIIPINSRDDLCCVRAIVTMRARVDAGDNLREPTYVSLRRGLPLQERMAKELHQKAGVPEGPCGIKELQMFQDALPDYQIKVLSVDKPHMIIFAGKEQAKQLLLVKVNDHYHGCSSFGGFLDKSYFCHDFNKGYNSDDHKHHHCEGRWCPGCKSSNCTELLSLKAALPTNRQPSPKETCPACNRGFYGDECHAGHLVASGSKRSLCETISVQLITVYTKQPQQKESKEEYPTSTNTSVVGQSVLFVYNRLTRVLTVATFNPSTRRKMNPDIRRSLLPPPVHVR